MPHEAFQQYRGAKRIDRDVLADLVHALADSDSCRKVHDAVNIVQRAPHSICVTDVTADKLHLWVEIFRALSSGMNLGGERVEHSHLISALQQRLCQVGADEAGTARDQGATAAHGDPPGTRRRAAQRSGCLDLDGADAGKGISDDLGRIRIWDHIDPASALPTVYIERG
jgi:hypothetical protein